MPYTNINDPSAYFTTTLWTGSGSSPRAITNDANSGNFQPDFVWTKGRNEAYEHQLYDSSRGTGESKGLTANDASAEGYVGRFGYLSSFDSNGFTGTAGSASSIAYFNASAKTYVAWQWKANGGTTTSVSASGTGSGCVNACTYQANTTAGFSIITYTGRDDQLNNGQESKLTHGLGVAPDATIMKRRDGTGDWFVMGAFDGVNGYPYSNNQFLKLNGTETINGNYYVGDTAPDATHIFLGNEYVNIASATYVCYAFAEKQGYSKFGKYVGNGARDGVFVYTGFQPAFVMIKCFDAANGRWTMFDNKRTIANGDMDYLVADATNAESDAGLGYTDPIDLVSNGFKIRNSDLFTNQSGASYIYMAFAENPFVTSTGVPTTAR